MGKALIIKNADFSDIAIRRDYQSVNIILGGINLSKTSPSYGMVNHSGSSTYYKRACTEILFPLKKGETLFIKGLRSGGKFLKVDGAYYPSPQYGLDVIDTLNGGSNYYPFNTQGLDEFVFTNNIGDYWFGFSFATGDNADIDINDYNIYVAVE